MKLNTLFISPLLARTFAQHVPAVRNHLARQFVNTTTCIETTATTTIADPNAGTSSGASQYISYACWDLSALCQSTGRAWSTSTTVYATWHDWTSSTVSTASASSSMYWPDWLTTSTADDPNSTVVGENNTNTKSASDSTVSTGSSTNTTTSASTSEISSLTSSQSNVSDSTTNVPIYTVVVSGNSSITLAASGSIPASGNDSSAIVGTPSQGMSPDSGPPTAGWNATGCQGYGCLGQPHPTGDPWSTGRPGGRPPFDNSSITISVSVQTTFITVTATPANQSSETSNEGANSTSVEASMTLGGDNSTTASGTWQNITTTASPSTNSSGSSNLTDPTWITRNTTWTKSIWLDWNMTGTGFGTGSGSWPSASGTEGAPWLNSTITDSTAFVPSGTGSSPSSGQGAASRGNSTSTDNGSLQTSTAASNDTANRPTDTSSIAWTSPPFGNSSELTSSSESSLSFGTGVSPTESANVTTSTISSSTSSSTNSTASESISSTSTSIIGNSTYTSNSTTATPASSTTTTTNRTTLPISTVTMTATAPCNESWSSVLGTGASSLSTMSSSSSASISSPTFNSTDIGPGGGAATGSVNSFSYNVGTGGYGDIGGYAGPSSASVAAGHVEEGYVRRGKVEDYYADERDDDVDGEGSWTGKKKKSLGFGWFRLW